MGFLSVLKDQAIVAKLAVQTLARRNMVEKLHLKMEIFRASWKGEVIAGRELAMDTYLFATGEEVTNSFMTHYIRVVFPQAGHTEFFWFVGEKKASVEANNYRARGFEVIGPYPLPTRDYDRFQ